MKTFALFWILSWLMGSATGRLLIAVAVLWYLDNRYVGLLASLWAPVVRAQRISGLRHAVEVNPSDVRSMVELGDHYLHAGRPGAAAEYLEKALDRGEDSARAIYLLGGALVQLGRHAEGRARLEAAVAQMPTVGYGEPYIFLLQEAVKTDGPQSQRVEGVVAQLDQFDGVEVLTRAGRVCAAAGRKDLARRLFEEAIRNYGYIPRKMRRRERRWLFRARLGLLSSR